MHKKDANSMPVANDGSCGRRKNFLEGPNSVKRSKFCQKRFKKGPNYVKQGPNAAEKGPNYVKKGSNAAEKGPNAAKHSQSPPKIPSYRPEYPAISLPNKLFKVRLN